MEDQAYPALDRVVVFDTETGGLDPLNHSLLSIGLVSGDGTQRTEVFVREPQLVTNPRSMEVNGIDLAWLDRNGLSPVEAVDAVEMFIEGLRVPRPVMMVGHNIAFDVAFMRRLYALADRPIPRDFSHRTVDTHTLLWSLAATGKLPDDATSSDGAFAFFEIAPPPEARHTALGDAIATRELLLRLLPLIG